MSDASILQAFLNGLTYSGNTYCCSGTRPHPDIMNIVQLAHGEVYMIAAYVLYYLSGTSESTFTCRPHRSWLVFSGRDRARVPAAVQHKAGKAMVLTGVMIILQNIMLAIATGTPKTFTTPGRDLVADQRQQSRWREC